MTQNILPFEKIKFKVLTKKKAGTSQEYGLDPNKRPVSDLIQCGVINLNKPKGPTSHLTSEYVQKTLKIKKAGHSGTLDPGVTGVLPIALGKATKVLQILIPAGKEYIGIMHLHKSIDKKQIKDVFKEFTGKIKQMPPIKSAVRRKIRERKIYYIEILEIEDQDVLFKVGCQAGTYIRKLCHDIGKKLKIGAHMAQLMRTQAGPFKKEEAVTIHDLADAFWYYKNENNEKFIRKFIKPIESAIDHIQKVWILDMAVDTVSQGANLNLPGIAKLTDQIRKNSIVAIMTLKNELVALGKAELSSEDIILNDKGLAIKTSKVFMNPGIYPKFKR